jgi:hypothetical protein
MSETRKRLLWSAAIAVAVIVGTIAGLMRVAARRPPGVPSEAVPPSWTEYRTSLGHQQHVGKGTIVCNDCHDFAKAGFVNPGAGVCSRCHDKEAGHTHQGGDKKTDCLVCHAFSPRAAPTCIGCHAESQTHVAAISTHRTTECQSCHRPHETPPVNVKACTNCHDERALSHARHKGSNDCRDCHKPHAPAIAARETCSGCHEKPAGPKPAGHDSCMTCHKPHDFLAQAPRVCVGCHGAKPTLLASMVTEKPMPHAQCTACHTPHAPAAAASSCRGCHSDVHVDHKDKDACTACHVPHGDNTTAKASACSSCHTKSASTDQGTHARGLLCTQCHKPHTFPPPESKLALCTDCHANESARVADNKGHHDCTVCHGTSTHQPAPAPPCSTCHTQEAASAPAGHQKCALCHEPHSGQRVQAAATCTSCHQNKTQVLHANLSTGCETCHRAHGPDGVAAPPACSTCHASNKLPALHAVPAHASCSECHSSHTTPRSDRETCTATCHQNRRDHQPQAAVCTGCHVFRD